MLGPKVGLEAFMDGLRGLGFQPAMVRDCVNGVVFEYVVETGKYAGKQVCLGFIVPPDFPATPPTGPHVSPVIHPVAPHGDHPYGGIHQTQSAPFHNGVGGNWQYWSRPFPGWAQEKKTVTVYMGHIWRLWDTQ